MSRWSEVGAEVARRRTFLMCLFSLADPISTPTSTPSDPKTTPPRGSAFQLIRFSMVMLARAVRTAQSDVTSVEARRRLLTPEESI